MLLSNEGIIVFFFFTGIIKVVFLTQRLGHFMNPN